MRKEEEKFFHSIPVSENETRRIEGPERNREMVLRSFEKKSTFQSAAVAIVATFSSIGFPVPGGNRVIKPDRSQFTRPSVLALKWLIFLRSLRSARCERKPLLDDAHDRSAFHSAGENRNEVH